MTDRVLLLRAGHQQSMLSISAASVYDAAMGHFAPKWKVPFVLAYELDEG